MIDHYKQTDPLGVPGAAIPDPMKLPNNKAQIAVGTIELKNALAHGISKFRIKSVDLDVEHMMVSQFNILFIITNMNHNY